MKRKIFNVIALLLVTCGQANSQPSPDFPSSIPDIRDGNTIGCLSNLKADGINYRIERTSRGALVKIIGKVSNTSDFIYQSTNTKMVLFADNFPIAEKPLTYLRSSDTIAKEFIWSLDIEFPPIYYLKIINENKYCNTRDNSSSLDSAIIDREVRSLYHSN